MPFPQGKPQEAFSSGRQVFKYGQQATWGLARPRIQPFLPRVSLT
jgi:hypothetical protein